MSEPTIHEIKQSVRIEDVIGRFVHLKKEGHRFKAPCPFHGEDTPSFIVTPNKGIFKCFGCGAAGDVIDFLVQSGKSFKEALQYLKDPNNTAALSFGQKMPVPTPPPQEWKQIIPKRPFVAPDTTHYKFGKPSMTWAYRQSDGEIIGLVCRFDTPEGKQVWPFTYCSNGKGKEEWRWKGFEYPRPLYNQHLMAEYPSQPIIIGEGEKTADAIQALIMDHIGTTWIGGVNNVKNTDWSPLYGRDIILWPDNDKEKKYGNNHPRKGQVMDFQDQPGNAAMFAIAEILKEHCPSIKWVTNPEDAPCGWDLADATWSDEAATFYFLDNTGPIPNPTAKIIEIKAPVPDKFEVEKHSIEDLKTQAKERKAPPDHDDENMRGGGYFKFLGYQKEGNGNSYSFYSFVSRTVITLSPSSMTLPNLLQLAPLKWWMEHLEGRKGGTVDLQSAQNWLIEGSAKIGIFNPQRIRGRGAWIDEKRVVIHAGDRLIVDGRETRFIDFHSKFVYEIGEEMGFSTKSLPLSTKDSKRQRGSATLIDILQLVNWEREINAYLLAGWCVIAPVCGALFWRPHIWLTGGAGTGKSWVFQHIIRPLLGQSAVSVQGETSEPGLRQLLKHDALPVVFDEAESEDRRAQDRIQDVLALMRSTSSNDGGIIAKGNSGGGGVTYKIRSCFAFASIALQIQAQSDRSRITILGIRNVKDSPEKKKRWEDLQKLHLDTMTEDYCSQLRSRTIALLPVILKNATTFASAAAAELGQQRAGDQIGALLAGAYSLKSKKLISYEEALEWIREKDWNEERSQESTRDEVALINFLMQQMTRIETESGIQERTIGELVRISAGTYTDPSMIITQVMSEDRLKRLGMRVINLHLLVGNDQDPIHKYLGQTKWSKNYHKILIRIEGAEKEESVRFATGIKSRAVKIPMKSIFTTDQGDLFADYNPGGGGIIAKKEGDDDLPF